MQIRNKLSRLTLSNDAVWERELKREKEGGGVEVAWCVEQTFVF